MEEEENSKSARRFLGLHSRFGREVASASAAPPSSIRYLVSRRCAAARALREATPVEVAIAIAVASANVIVIAKVSNQFPIYESVSVAPFLGGPFYKARSHLIAELPLPFLVLHGRSYLRFSLACPRQLFRAF